MLTEIRCEQFREKTIGFRKGLNVVCGDEAATNSIGKSSLLMIIDFVFGGNSFIETNRDAIDELGHQEYFFSFQFGATSYFFCRTTLTPKIVSICDPDYVVLDSWRLSKFTAFLHDQYRLEGGVTFRSYIGPFSRVWPKDNTKNPSLPLHSSKNMKAADCVTNLVKIFGKYGDLERLDKLLKEVEDEKKALSAAFRTQLIKRINQREYDRNRQDIATWRSEYEEIKENLARFAINIKEITSKELLEFKQEKDSLLDNQQLVTDKLSRIRKNLKSSGYKLGRGFERLREFFPDVDSDRLKRVESFHNGISSILKRQLRASEQLLQQQLDNLSAELVEINTRIEVIQKSFDAPTIIIDRVSELSNRINRANEEIYFFEKERELASDRKSKNEELAEERGKVTEYLERKINEEISEISSEVYGATEKRPTLKLSPNAYSYELFEDTGTGRAYSILLILDLAIFSATNLPILIHDTLLFKNVENSAVSQLVRLYSSFEKQSFIALDEVSKYGEETEDTLLENMVIQLNDEHVLFVKDWRNKGPDN